MALDDPELFKYPVAYIIEPGWWTMTDGEAAAFRTYLQKGGFVIVDDFKIGRAHLSTPITPTSTLFPSTTLFRSVAYIIEPGWWTMTDGEAAAFRTYLQKGGFVIVDDF